MLEKNIPAITFAGMFFFCACAMADQLQLAVDLFEKGEWNLCRRECRRALLSNAEPAVRYQLLGAMSSIRSGISAANAVDLLQPIVESGKDDQIAAIAAYELGRMNWQLGESEKAFDSFSRAFNTTTDKALFLRSSCSLFLLLKEFPSLKNGNDGLVSQINTSRTLWTGSLFAECGKPGPASTEPVPPNWIIRFYRSQISPAIGSRCVLEPSCSEYYHRASCKHGFIAIPMMADRLFREPEISNGKENPVVMKSGQIRYRDPVENHDFWMKK